MKHNKIKNTGILFELLTKSIMHEVIGQPTNQVALGIVRKHFKKDSELLKELALYQALSTRTDHDANELINLVLERQKTINEKQLELEKYNLVKSLKKHYDLKIFFESRLPNYKLLASVYTLLEKTTAPTDFLDCKRTITEHLCGNVQTDPIASEVEQLLAEQDADVRKLTFKIIVEQFNEKYKQLNTKQKTLLSQYVTHDSNSPDFKKYVLSEVQFIIDKLNQFASTSTDPVQRIKLTETVNLTQNIISAKYIKDEHLSAMLKYYELIEEFEK